RFFIAGEGLNGLARRFADWSKARATSLADVPLFKSERAAQFLDMDSAGSVAEAVASFWSASRTDKCKHIRESHKLAGGDATRLNAFP
ncbi:MAG: hypothetical protein ACO2YL_08100, partial [Paracoccaceae bacterium]